jgi:cytochrome c oxidase subunit 1
MWIMGLVLSGLGTILSGVNFVTTIVCMRAPGMTMFRMPIFTWNILVTSIMVLLAFPVLAAALLVLEIDRKLGAHVFASANGVVRICMPIAGCCGRKFFEPGCGAGVACL